MAEVVLSPTVDAGDSSVVDNTNIEDHGAAGDQGADDGAGQGVIPDNDSDQGDQSDQGEQGDQQNQSAGDQNKGAANLGEAAKKHLAELSKTNKPLAEAFKRNEFKVREYEKIYKTPAEALEVKGLMESLVGPDGETGAEAIERLQTDAQEFAAEINQFREGQTDLLDALAKDSPQGLAKLVPHGVKLLKSIDQAGYDRLSGAIMDELFVGKNVYDHVQRLMETVAAGGEGAQQNAYALVQQLQKFLGAYKQYSGQGNTALDAERSTFEKQKQDWQTKQATETENKFAENVLGSVNPAVTKQVKDHIATMIPKGYKMPDGTSNQIVTEVFRRINAKLLERPDYKTRYDALLKTRDPKRVSNFIRSRVDPILLDLTKSVYQDFRGVVPPRKAGAGNAGAGAGKGNQNQNTQGVQNRKPTLDEALSLGFSKIDWINALSARKLAKNGKVLFQWQ
jgi:hypothetical protein